MKFFLLLIILITHSLCFSINVNKTLVINSGLSTCFDGNQMFYNTFNATNSFENKNVLISINTGDSLYLKVINNDSITHGFSIKWSGNPSVTIPSGDSINVVFSSQNITCFIYYDHLNYPNNSYVGLSGIIAVGNNPNSFYWNIKDHQLSLNDSIGAGSNVNWSNYYPDYFTINGQSNPNINLDTTARVTGSVGDTIFIYIANTGQAEHSIHFHGYHCDILFSSYKPNHVGRSKDTFPIKIMETYVLRLIPDKPGEYPVHDHNLLSVTGGGLYPFGMFLTMLIQ